MFLSPRSALELARWVHLRSSELTRKAEEVDSKEMSDVLGIVEITSSIVSSSAMNAHKQTGGRGDSAKKRGSPKATAVVGQVDASIGRGRGGRRAGGKS